MEAAGTPQIPCERGQDGQVGKLECCGSWLVTIMSLTKEALSTSEYWVETALDPTVE